MARACSVHVAESAFDDCLDGIPLELCRLDILSRHAWCDVAGSLTCASNGALPGGGILATLPDK
ncbi:hypothetical protein [Undibacter mobilis]|uniref:hypothetical protein n=1 Tax=Undibacter mobilis TaxID=2292256 RepID=UPI003D31D572